MTPSLSTSQAADKRTKPIALYTFYNEDFMQLKDRFLSTLQDDYEIHCIRSDFDTGGKPIDKAVDMFIARGEIICKAIRDNIPHYGSSEEGIIILSDIDIQFFRPTEATVREALKHFDMAFQKDDDEGNGKNMGFIALHCNERTLKFWQNVLEEIRTTGNWEQAIVNDFIHSDDMEKNLSLNCGTFPDAIWNPILTSRPHDIILHHAVYAGVGQTGKLRQMNMVMKAIARGRFGSLKIKKQGNSLLSELRHARAEAKTKGAYAVATTMIPGILYRHLIDKNLGRSGQLIKKLSPKAYSLLKSRSL